MKFFSCFFFGGFPNDKDKKTNTSSTINSTLDSISSPLLLMMVFLFAMYLKVLYVCTSTWKNNWVIINSKSVNNWYRRPILLIWGVVKSGSSLEIQPFSSHFWQKSVNPSVCAYFWYTLYSQTFAWFTFCWIHRKCLPLPYFKVEKYDVFTKPLRPE